MSLFVMPVALRGQLPAGRVAQIVGLEAGRNRLEMVRQSARPFTFIRLAVISMIINHHWRPI